MSDPDPGGNVEIGLLWPHLPVVESRRSRGKSTSGRRAHKSSALSCFAEPERVLFLDIETTGLSRHYDELTMVGYQYSGRYHAFVVGDDPSHLLATLRAASSIVTFNGTLFDLPFLRKEFPGIEIPQMHVDLRYAAKRVGLVGGQKEIERELGLNIRNGVDGLDGSSAVLLWHRYLRGDTESLRTLIRYNLADIMGMRGILDVVRDRIDGGDLLFETIRFAASTPVLMGHAKPGADLPSSERLGRIARSFSSLFGHTPAGSARVVGIDLTGSEARPTGVCVLRGPDAHTALISSDDDIIAAVVEAGPELVSIDSPLSLPFGRITVFDSDPGRGEFGIMRSSERTLKRRGINVYPCLLPSMQRLTARGMQLAARFRSLGIPVIESYPGAAQDIMGIPRKGAGEQLLKAGLAEFGIRGSFTSVNVSHDELDAITSALVGVFFMAGKYEALTGQNEGALIIPDLNARGVFSCAVGISGHIGAGKTTAAQMLEAQGYTYVRFSQIVDKMIEADGLVPNRALRQDYGWRLHVDLGQEWLVDQVLELARDSKIIVVDGLRFPEDHAHLAERFGNSFRHIHLRASEEVRARRKGMEPSSREWNAMEDAQTERQVDLLGKLADATIDNIGDLTSLQYALKVVVPRITVEGPGCLSRS